MGTVWLAHPYDDPNQLYAVKTVSPQFARDPAVCGMFVKEASLAAALDHPNVVRLYDVGIHDDVPFFVMEWVDGFSLRDVAKAVVETGERVPPSIALRIGSDMCGGLHAAHELCGDDGHHLGLVHRDISPHNVLVARDGVSKIIDFGVAKARDLATNTEESMVGGLKGKVRYMAPEQALEREIDRRADLFSVGAVLYQLLTGRAPFEGPNEMAIINALMSTNPVYVPDDLPEPVQWILRRALARRPENRFGDAAEMQNAIELALVEMGAPDKHYDVAECLAWFVPLGDPPEYVTASRRALPIDPDPDDLGTPVRSTNSPPPLAFAGPNETGPARRMSLIDVDEIAMQQRSRRSSGGGAMRALFIAAGAVVILGGGVVYALHDDAPKDDDWGKKSAADDPGTTELDNAPLGSSTAVPTATTVTPSTPIIDVGDVEDNTKPDAQKKKKRRPKPADSSGAGGAAPAPATPPSKPGDLAGPIKVWK
ncbi:MAG: serine/threonine protein kinase [Labilithrix sp.]|nr:serine/threonine protein kinase [Labilithrix sp.]MCW5812300.1 serine/threonine protein kinase [Labilithrix sp.]